MLRHILWFRHRDVGTARKLINAYLMKDGTPFTDRAGWEKMPFTEEVKDRDPRLAQTVRTPGYHRIGQTEILAPDLSVSVTVTSLSSLYRIRLLLADR